MSKFFFKGRIDIRQDYGSYGFNTNRSVKSGTQESPLDLRVKSEQRKIEVEALLAEHDIHAVIVVDSDKDEELRALESLINKPKSVVVDKVPARNEPCSCGSGKKYKKCCA
jgi:SWIM/SEC-C metal-binding protein